MAVEFSGAVGQRIDFGTSANVYGLSQKSISFWFKPDTVAANAYFAFILFNDGTPFANEAWGIVFGVDGTGDLLYAEAFDTQEGQWSIPTSTFSAGTQYHIVITMDNSSDENNPSCYVNKVSKPFTEDLAPSGSASSGTSSKLRIGARDAATAKAPDGIIADPRIYNRIITQAEIDELFDSKNQRSVISGLVFAPFLDGAAGLSRFDGATLGTSNVIKDWISGVSGTPNGNPIGRGNTIQRIY